MVYNVKVKSPYRYPGGKSKRSVRQKILKYAPADYKEMREPFVGGGGIFLPVPPHVTRWINDKDAGLIAVYKALQERPEEFINDCRAIRPPDPSETEPPPTYNRRLKGIFDILKIDTRCDPALRYYFINRTGWAGRVNYDIPSRQYFSNPTGWNVVDKDTLPLAASLLEGVRITCGDYSPLLSEAGDDVWIYLDPPYLVNSAFAPTSQLYQHNFTLEDHLRLEYQVRTCRHKVLLSYDDDDAGYVRTLYRNYNIHEAEWTYCGSSRSRKETGKELVITNY